MNPAWTVRFHRQAVKDLELCKRAGLGDKVKVMVQLISENPWETPPPYEKLVGNLVGLYSRRINRQHRMVYSVDEERKLISILALWTHYEHG